MLFRALDTSRGSHYVRQCRRPSRQGTAYPGRLRPDLDTADELLGGVDCSKREKRRAPVTAKAGRYVRRRKQEIATPLDRQVARLAKVSAASGRLLVEVTKLVPGLAGVSAPGLLNLNA